MMGAKDDSIVRLVEKLEIERRGWRIQDHWDADLCAIGISSQVFPRRLVYVSTFGKLRGKYDYACEQLALDGQDETDYDTVSAGNDVDFRDLVVAMEHHLTPIP